MDKLDIGFFWTYELSTGSIIVYDSLFSRENPQIAEKYKVYFNRLIPEWMENICRIFEEFTERKSTERKRKP